MADLNCPNCGATYSFSEQIKSNDHWFKSGSCPKCREGILEPEKNVLSLTQTIALSVALIGTMCLALLLHTFGLAEWTSGSLFVYAAVFALAFYIPIYFVGRSFFSSSN